MVGSGGGGGRGMREPGHTSAGHVDVFSGAMGDDETDAAFDRVFGLSHQAFDLSGIAAPSAGGNFDFSHGLGERAGSSIHSGGLGGSGGLHATLGGLPMNPLSGMHTGQSPLQGPTHEGGVGGRIDQPHLFQLGGGGGGVGGSRKRKGLSPSNDRPRDGSDGNSGDGGSGGGGGSPTGGGAFGTSSEEGLPSSLGDEGRGSSAGSEGSASNQALLDMFT